MIPPPDPHAVLHDLLSPGGTQHQVWLRTAGRGRANKESRGDVAAKGGAIDELLAPSHFEDALALAKDGAPRFFLRARPAHGARTARDGCCYERRA